MAETARAHLTVDEFFAWEENQPDKHELVDGLPLRMMAGGSRSHNLVSMNVIGELRARLRGSDCSPFNGDSAVETKPGQFRRPDGGVECGPNPMSALRVKTPRVIVEVLSPSTRDFDTYRKTAEYKLIPSLDRILLIDPNRPEIFMWSRDAAREWEETTVRGLEATIGMPELGIELPLSEIYLRVEFPTELRLVPGE